MRIRIRPSTSPTSHVLTLPSTATVSDLLSAITNATSILLFDLKSGFPPRPLDLHLFPPSTLLADVGVPLDNQQILVSPQDLPGTELDARAVARQQEDGRAGNEGVKPSASMGTTNPTAAASPRAPLRLSKPTKSASKASQDDPPTIALPNRLATLHLHVMPDDNSCLFRALGASLVTPSVDSAAMLRDVVASDVLAHRDEYPPAMLENRSAEDYGAWIRHPDAWGGGIEMKVIAERFGVVVVCVSVEDGRVDRFVPTGMGGVGSGSGGLEGKMVVVVYSGIHYDAVALVPDGADGVQSDAAERVFDVADDEVVDAVVRMCAELRARNYFTNPGTFAIGCNTCGWKGKGEKDAVAHNTKTGHVDFEQVD